jgi:hypothetical protein
MAPGDGFWPGAAKAAAPLGVWALHFAFCYVSVPLACHAGWQRVAWGPTTLLHLWLLAGTAVALAAAALLARAAWRAAGGDGLVVTVRRVGAALAVTGIVWNAVPVFVLPACRVA